VRSPINFRSREPRKETISTVRTQELKGKGKLVDVEYKERENLMLYLKAGEEEASNQDKNS